MTSFGQSRVEVVAVAANSERAGAEAADGVGVRKFISMPDCPPEFAHILEEVSLECLVYWKLKRIFDKFEGLPAENVLKTVLEHVERPLCALILKRTNGNQSKAAKVLGCNRNTLYRKLKEFSLEPLEIRRAIKSHTSRFKKRALHEEVSL